MAPSRRRRRVARVPRSGRASTSSVGLLPSAIRRASLATVVSSKSVARGDDNSIPKGRIRRTAQVGSVVGTQGARYAGTRAANLTRSPEEAAGALERRHLEAAERMVATLGRMKGAAMKIGQLASFIDTEFLPPEYRALYQEHLAALRTEAPSMPWEKVKRVLDEEWAEPCEELFEDFDEEAAAGA